MLLLIYFLLFETMITVERNLPPYLDTMFDLGSTAKSLAFLIVVVFALVGGVLASKVITFFNAEKRLKIGSLSLVVGIILITVGNLPALVASTIIAGISYGVLETAIRTHFMNHFSPEHAGRNFGVLAMVERTSGTI
ncbi:MAG: MFS transporter [Candidatus Peribacteria bacterium]|jgi:MFS-type transporter involved in bile tolerance (Atg22 family)|nr:MFS transporter [Candidatus Peribacteria bacterium]